MYSAQSSYSRGMRDDNDIHTKKNEHVFYPDGPYISLLISGNKSNRNSNS